MTKLKKLLLSVVALTVLMFAFSVSVYASGKEILADGCTVLVQTDGTEGVALVASYDKKGILKKIVTEPVTKDNPALFKELEVGDKVMFWDSLKTMNPLAPSVTVTGIPITDTNDKNNQRIQNEIYKVAVEKALVEALGENKGKDLTDLQKALHLHDWLIKNCMYQLDYIHGNLYTAYGAIAGGRAVCGGYTAAYAVLLEKVGIKVSKRYGMPPFGSEVHEWNVVTIDGKNYYVDVAADDGSTDVAGGGGYFYFLVDAESFIRRGYQFNNNDNCTDTTYNEYSLFRDGAFPLIWNESEQIYYFVDKDKVKTTDKTFSTEISKQTSETDQHPNSVIWTEDKKWLCYIVPSNYTHYGTVYLYNFEKDEYYSYEIKDAPFYVIFAGLREKDNNLEITRSGYINLTGSEYNIDHRYITFKEMSIPIPETCEKRKVTFNQNYNGGTSADCYYLDNYWTNGDGSFDAPERDNFTFRGWFTARNGGTEVKNYEEISGDNATLYAHWWGEWEITKDPTETATGTLTRKLESNEKIIEEITLPVLTDTSFWTLVTTQESKTEKEGYKLYNSKYGRVRVILPKKEKECAIEVINGKYWFSLLETGTYYAKFEIGGKSETVEKVNNYGECKLRINFPESLSNLKGKLTITLYDSTMKQLCQAEFEVE